MKLKVTESHVITAYFSFLNEVWVIQISQHMRLRFMSILRYRSLVFLFGTGTWFREKQGNYSESRCIIISISTKFSLMLFNFCLFEHHFCSGIFLYPLNSSILQYLIQRNRCLTPNANKTVKAHSGKLSIKLVKVK